MTRRYLLLMCLFAVVSYAPNIGFAAEFDPMSDEQLLRSFGLRTTGPALLHFLSQRSQEDVKPDELRKLALQLSDADPVKREQAAAELIGFGPPALPYVREVAKDLDNRDLGGWTRRCLDAINGPNSQPLSVAVVRLTAHRKPENAAKVLLQYLPSADNETVVEQVRRTLSQLALVNEKPEPALLAALEDKTSIRRAVAAEVLCRLGPLTPEEALKKLLKDPTAGVRLHVALALAQGQNAEAISVLIELLEVLPPHKGRLAEDFLFELAQDQSPHVNVAVDEASRKKARQEWANWWKKTEGESLLDEFRKRTLTDVDQEKVLKLIGQLGDNNFDVREKATEALCSMNYKIAPLLRRAETSTDLEVRSRAQKCLQAVESGKDRIPPLSAVSARLVALRRPQGAVDVLLSFIASVDREPALEEVQIALSAIAFRDGTVEPSLLKALEDKNPQKRAAAATALVYAKARDQFPTIRKMLKDSDAHVRMSVGLALASSAEKEAVPVLIELLAELTGERADRTLDFLRSAAKEKSPAAGIGATEAERKRCRDDWLDWWKQNGEKLELAVVERPTSQIQMGYTLLVLPDMGQIMELGADKKTVRWQINGLSSPFQAQMLPGDKVLIAETGGSRVTERNLRGEILWEYRVGSPVGCQRLSNGNTLVVTPNNLIEVDRDKKEILNRPCNGPNYYSAQKLRNGQIVCVTSQSTCLLLDSKGQETKNFRINPVGNYCCMEALPSGRILVAQIYNNKVTEYDQDGKVIWEATVQQPCFATRLANGNTLVACQYPGKTVEIDRTGKQVWEYIPQNQTRVGQVLRR